MAQLDSFAHDLYTILTVGNKISEERGEEAARKIEASTPTLSTAGLASAAGIVTGERR